MPSFMSPLANQLTCYACMLCLCLQVNWALGALLSEVLQQGGHALGRAHDHIILAAPGAEQGASDAAAGATAATFCLFLLLLSTCLNYCRVGVVGAAVHSAALPAAAGVGAGSSNARSGGGGSNSAGGRAAAAGSSSSSSGGIGGVVSGLVAAAVSAAADAGSAVTHGGSRGKYTRLRAVSPNTYAGVGEQLQLPVSTRPAGSSSSRPASRPASLGHSGGGVIEVAAYAAGQPLSDRVSSQGGRVSAGVLTARR
jgi:hypothetical protein